MKTILSRFTSDESGASAIEYGLIAGIIGLGLVVGLSQVRNSIYGLYTSIQTGFKN